MFKRILKIVSIVLAGFVVIVGASMGIYALTGGFKEKDINIIKIYIDDSNKAEKQIYTLSDFSTQINYEPLDATNKELEVIISDPLRQVDENGNLIKEGILKNVPKKINAGDTFNVEINKDEKGNNIGGVVSITFRPLNTQKNITDFTLKVIVDVEIPNNSLYFAGNESDDYNSVGGKTITMGISNSQQYILLKSELVNAFYLQANNKNMKNAQISYSYKLLNGKYYDVDNDKTVDTVVYKKLDNLVCERIYNATTGSYNYFYKIPVTPKESGTIQVYAKMHKTYEIEKAFEENDFGDMKYPSYFEDQHSYQLLQFNKFINDFITYFDTSDTSYNFFKNYLTEDGKVRFTKVDWENGAINGSSQPNAFDFIFQTCTSTINISAVNLKSISSVDVVKCSNEKTYFDVFTTRTYSLTQLINDFELDIKLEEDNVAQIDKEKSNLFSTLEVTPFIYIEKTVFANDYYAWKDYQEILLVDGFESKKPVCTLGNISSNLANSLAGNDYISEIDEYLRSINKENAKGFLVNLSSQFKDKTYKDYMTISMSPNANSKMWTIAFNVPISKGATDDINSVSKALFVEFKVTGRDVKTNKATTKTTYSRVAIGYTDYNFVQPADTSKPRIDNIYLDNSLIKRMAINQKLTTNFQDSYADKIKYQEINLNLNSILNNYSKVQYKSVMYFVEEKSNSVEGGSKLASIGKYKFKYMDPQLDSTGAMNDTVKLFDDEELIGERLPLFGDAESTTKNYLRALNASIDPAYLFAVVYLSDKDGNPIDSNGRLININESLDGAEPTSLVVFQITHINTTDGISKVYVDNFVDNINYYTQNMAEIKITNESIQDGEKVENTYTISEGNGKFLRRNNISSFTTEDGVTLGQKALEELQSILKLKLLYNNKFTLYATNFDLDGEGNIIAQDGENVQSVKMIDFFGKNVVKEFAINTTYNKQLALNEMLGLNKFNFASKDEIITYFRENYLLNINSLNSNAVQNVALIEKDETIIGFQFDIVSIGKNSTTDGTGTSSGDYIYIKANSNVTNALNDNDSVNWEVNNLVIDDVQIDYDKTKAFEKLYSRYSGNSDGSQKFGMVNYDSASSEYTFAPFYLYRFDEGDNKPEKGSAGDNVKYTILTNLYDLNSSTLNKNLIDCSQLVYTNENADATNDYENKVFKDICSYIEYYTINSNSVKISYQNPKSVIGLKDDLVFTNRYNSDINSDEQNIIYIGNESYPILGGKIIVNGISYDVVKEDNNIKKVILKAGTYYPEVEVSGDTSKYVLIMGQKFRIYSSGGNNVINTIPDVNEYQKASRVETNFKLTGSSTVYNPHAYINDGTNTSSETALIKEVDSNNKVISAKVNFRKGGAQLEDAGNGEFRYKFVQDNNGLYKFVQDNNGLYTLNGIKGSFVLASQTETGVTRYSKHGIIAYLMIKYVFSDVTIVKALEYELIQEPIEIVANVVGNKSVIIENEVKTWLGVNAGSNIEFKFGNQSQISDSENTQSSINLLNVGIEPDFFGACTIEIENGAGNNAGIKFKLAENSYSYTLSEISNDSTVTLVIPDSYNGETSAVIKISYRDENGNNVSKRMGLNVKGNYPFGAKEDKLKNGDIKYDSESKSYRITKSSSDTAYSVSEIINDFFACTYIGEGTKSISIKLKNIDGDLKTPNLSNLNEDNLNIYKSYSYLDENGKVSKNYLKFKICIYVDDNLKFELKDELWIDVTPDYVFDLKNLEGKNITVLNGQSLYDSKYIKLYTLDSNKQLREVTDSETYQNVLASAIKITLEGNNYLNNGIVKLDDWTLDRTFEKSRLQMIGQNDYTLKEIEFNVTVKAYELYFGIDKDYSLNNGEDRVDTYDRIKTDNKFNGNSLDLYYVNSQNLNLDKYFAVFSKGNSVKTNLYAVLVSGENIYHNVTVDNYNLLSNTKLGFAVLNNGNFELVYETNISVTLKVVTLFRNAEGNIQDTSTFDHLSQGGYLMTENLTLTLAKDTPVTTSYLKVFVGNSTASDIKFVDSSNAENIKTYDNLKVEETTKTYKITIKIGEITFDTGFTITLNPVSA